MTGLSMRARPVACTPLPEHAAPGRMLQWLQWLQRLQAPPRR
jgi:hypothetical protein